MLKKCKVITKEQLAEVKQLSIACKKEDGSSIPYHGHILMQNRVFPSIVFYYENDELVGFLCAFFFYIDKCEITVIVRPNARRQGIAKKMLVEVYPLFIEHNIKTLFFSVVHDQYSAYLMKKNFQFLHSEYNMQRLSSTKQTLNKKYLKIAKARLQNIPFLASVDKLCFNNEIISAQKRLKEILSNKNYEIMILVLRDKFIGKSHIHYLDNKVRLTDIGVLPEYQGKGYGATLLGLLINYLIYKKHTNICLEVEAKNKHALQLYTKVGFNITNIYDFWSITTNNLGKILALQ